MTNSPSPLFSDNDWRISDKQRTLIEDRIRKLSKKEAGLLITFIESCLFGRRRNNEQS